MSVTINLATRGRPERLLVVVEKTAKMLTRDDTCYMISVDDDDQPTLDIVDKLSAVDSRVFVNIKPREDAIGDKWSRNLERPADVYTIQGDYRVPTKPGWDAMLNDAAALFPDGIGGVYSHMDNASFPAATALTHGLTTKLGYFYPSVYPFWFVDHHADDILRIIDRIAFIDMSFDTVGGRKPNTHEMREVPFWATFFDCQRLVRRRAAHAIINSADFQEPEWRKKILLSHHPLIEYRSQWINDSVRDMFANADPNMNTGGDRYRRVKEQASAIMRELWPELKAEMGVAA